MKDGQNKKSQSVKIVTSCSHGVHIEDKKEAQEYYLMVQFIHQVPRNKS